MALRRQKILLMTYPDMFVDSYNSDSICIKETETGRGNAMSRQMKFSMRPLTQINMVTITLGFVCSTQTHSLLACKILEH